MNKTPCFSPAHILLPSEQIPVGQWGCVACDQFTSDRSYWEKAAQAAAGGPRTLDLILPEVYLEEDDVDARISAIHAAMDDYTRNVLTRAVDGFIYVERTEQSGRVRQGLVGRIDLEAYSYAEGAVPAIRPSEHTVESRIPPRMAVRRGARLETPHIMMLADDPGYTLIEPIGEKKEQLRKVYEGDLMLNGGHLAGWAVEDPALVEQINTALANLGDAAAFAARWPAAAGQPPMTLAVGDGNHSLATAKAYWEELKPTLPPEQQQTHPARWCLAEVCNVHSPAIEIEPIHRVLFGVDANTVAADFGSWLEQHGAALQGGDQHIVLAGAGAEITFDAANTPDPLAVGTTEHFIGDYLAQNPGVTVDYIHGAAAARAMAADPAKPATALLMPDFAKADLFKGVVLGGVLPRKTFSMGHAEEKRYYNECRSLTMPD